MAVCEILQIYLLTSLKLFCNLTFNRTKKGHGHEAQPGHGAPRRPFEGNTRDRCSSQALYLKSHFRVVFEIDVATEKEAMQELIKVESRKVGSEEIQAVSARDLHEALGVKMQFTHWIKPYLRKFVVSQEFSCIRLKQKTGHYREDYALSLDMAKHVAMMSDTTKSHEVRQYFIACEKKLTDILRKQLSEKNRQKHRETARLEYRPMTDALQDERGKLGKKTGWFHYANEADLINRIALGQTSAEFKAFHNVGSASVRDYLTELQIKCITDLQRANTVFLSMGMEFQERKAQLKVLFERNHHHPLIEEHFRITA